MAGSLSCQVSIFYYAQMKDDVLYLSDSYIVSQSLILKVSSSTLNTFLVDVHTLIVIMIECELSISFQTCSIWQNISTDQN